MEENKQKEEEAKVSKWTTNDSRNDPAKLEQNTADMGSSSVPNNAMFPPIQAKKPTSLSNMDFELIDKK